MTFNPDTTISTHPESSEWCPQFKVLSDNAQEKSVQQDPVESSGEKRDGCAPLEVTSVSNVSIVAENSQRKRRSIGFVDQA